MIHITQQGLDYWSVVKRVNPDTLSGIERQFARFEGKEEVLQESFKAFDLGKNFEDWDEAAYQALFCLKKGLITIDVFAEVLLTRKAYLSEQIDEQLTEAKNESLPIQRDEFGKMCTYYRNQDLEREIDYKQTLLTKEEQEEYFSLLNKESIRSRRLLYSRSKTDNIDNSIRTGQGFNIFNHTGEFRVFPSFRMMNIFLRVWGRDSAVTLNPVLDLSSERDISVNNVGGLRDLSLGFPSVPLPAFADGFKALGRSFQFHDFYHALIQSSLDYRLRLGINWMADIILSLNHFRIKKEFKEAFAFQVSDMDFAMYSRYNMYQKIDRDALFWYEVTEAWERGFREIVRGKTEFETRILDTLKPHQQMIIFRAMIQKLSEIQKEWDWESEFGIKMEAMHELPQVHRNAIRASEAMLLANQSEKSFEEAWKETPQRGVIVPSEVTALRDAYLELTNKSPWGP